MKQAKRKNSAAPVTALVADAAVSPANELPDAAYVEQLLAAAAPAEAVVIAGSFVSLPAQCLMRDAVEFKQRLLACLDAKCVEIDVAAVERVDTAFMQVLLAFVNSRPGSSEPVRWLNVNATFTEAAQLLGLQSDLMIPAVRMAA